MMPQLFSSDTPVLIQGMTGKEGSRMARWLLGSGVRVVAGVTPGKGGQEVEGRPIFDDVATAMRQFPEIVVSSIVVPAPRVLSAAEDALAAGIACVHILTEQVPVHDVIDLRDRARIAGATVLGPSSVGYLQFPRFRLGYLGGESPFELLKEGGVAVVSSSGGMANEIVMALSRFGVGIRLACAVGGDRVAGTTLGEAIAWCESLDEVKTVVVFAEPGQPWIAAVEKGTVMIKKPTVIFLAGDCLDGLPRGVPYGHTGTMLGEEDVSIHDLRLRLEAGGATCVGSLAELLLVCKTYAR